MAVTNPRRVALNLAVKDVRRSVDFFTKIGFEFNPPFTEEAKAARLVFNDAADAMLLEAEFFGTFTTTKRVCDTSTATEVIVAVLVDDKDEVDALVGNAIAAGAEQANEAQDHGTVYLASFYDLDGHMWEVIWADESTRQQ